MSYQFKINLTRGFIFFTLIGFMLSACETISGPEITDNQDVPTTTKIIGNKTWENSFIEMDSTSYTITFDKNVFDSIMLNEGDFIVSAEGYGLLRKISDITETNDNKIIVTTSAAVLTDVVSKGSVSFEQLLIPENIMEVIYMKEGVLLDTCSVKDEKASVLEYNISTYLDSENLIKLEGRYTLRTELKGDIEINYIPPRIELFELSYNVNQNLNLEASLNLIDVLYNNEVRLSKIRFNPITVFISGVPVVIVPELDIKAGIEVNIECGFSTSLNQEIDYLVGLKYYDSEWTTQNEFSKSYTYSPPQLDCNAGAKAYIKPEFKLKFYDVVSPYLYGSLYCRVEADINDDPWWSLYNGAEIGIGTKAEIFGREIFDFYSDPPLISFENIMTSADGPFYDPPIAAFSANPLSGNKPLEVAFTDQSSNTPTSWTWDFGDGSDSNDKNPIHTYTEAGEYTVSLTVTNDAGTDTETKQNLISVASGVQTPIAEFSADPKSGVKPLEVSFTDQSSNSPTSWTWDFGDGSSGSNERNPTHTYTNAGEYTVSLTVSNEAGTDNATKQNFISVTSDVQAPIAEFSSDIQSGAIPLEVSFTDQSSNTPTSWEWDFGDGSNVSNERNPTHTYESAGEYDVSLTVTNEAGSNTEVKTNYILAKEIVDPPAIDKITDVDKDEDDGNDNHYYEVGETLILDVELQNTGIGLAKNIVAKLSLDDSNDGSTCDLDTDELTLGELDPNATHMFESFEIDIEGMPNDKKLDFKLTITYEDIDGNSFTNEFSGDDLDVEIYYYKEITPSQDAFIASNGPNGNYNNSMLMVGLDGESYFSYVEFDLNTIPASSEIESADLKLYLITVDNSFVLGNSKITSNWNENTITYSNTPDFSSTSYTNSFSSRYNRWIEFDVNYANDWLDGSNYGIYIYPGSNEFTATFYSSFESGKEPKLCLTYR